MTLLAGVLLFGCIGTATESNTTDPGELMNKINVSEIDKKVATGSTVKVDYVGSLENGTVFDTSIEAEAKKAGLPQRPAYEPLEFKVGAGQMIPGFEKGVMGMKANQTKTITLPPEEGYGEPSDELLVSVPKATLEESNITLEVGTSVYTSTGAAGVITEVGDVNATIDFNHPLAGKTLVFRVTVRDIQ